MRAAVAQRLKQDSLDGLRVAVQGVGNVGRQLCKLLHEAGDTLIVTDVNADASQQMAERYGAAIVGTEEIYAQDVEVFSPCAMGAVINDATIPQLRASIIAGVANNQLAEPRHGTVLHERNILYAPDYVVNAGGMLNATGDIFGRYDVDEVMQRILKIYDTTREIFATSAAKNQPPSAIADALARAKIQAGKSQVGKSWKKD
jgi:leucine dehydrogenase